MAESAQQSGPDDVAESSRSVTWKRDEAVTLRMTREGQGAEKPLSMMTVLKRTVDKVPDRTAIAYKKDGKWKLDTYREYYEKIRQAARGFIKLGLQPEHGVGIIGFNSPEWFISDLAAIFAGGFATGIYTTNSAEACFYIIDDAQCDIIVVENEAQYKKIAEIRSRIPNVKAIIQYSGTPATGDKDVYTWKQLMDLGKSSPELETLLEERINNQAPNKCCTLIYTSGTTGNSKGVMLSHDNMTWTTLAMIKCGRIQFGQDVIVSYLPLSHAAGQLIDICVPVCSGASVYFAQPDALKGSLGTTLKEVRPTIFLGVPRVWEKMQEAMTAAGKANGAIKKWIASYARGVGLRDNLSGLQSKSICFSISDKLVFQKVGVALGLDRCKLFVSGAAPLNRQTMEFFLSLNIPIMEVYGMSESSGPHTVCLPWQWRIMSCGKEFPGAETVLDNPDKDGNGEICMVGRHVFMGYLNMEDKTVESIDSQGRLHSGDIGKKDKDGFLFITGRIKELIITAGGENVPPVLIEDKVKEVLPCVSNCMLVGDKRKFLSLLVTLKTEVDRESQEPLDALSGPALEWCHSVGSSATHVTKIISSKDAAIYKAIEAGIQKVNKASTSRAQCIQKWTLIQKDFSIPGGELGPTLKLKRPVVAQMYERTIEEFYADSNE